MQHFRRTNQYGQRVNRRHARPHRTRPRGSFVVTGVLAAAMAATTAMALQPGSGGSEPLAQPSASTAPDASPSPSSEPPPEPTPDPTPEPLPDAEFTIVAAGDVLPHVPVLASARSGEGYDFAPLLADLDPWIAGADLALCHFEVPVAPDGVPPSGYPMFGTVTELVDALAAQGWDGCSTASNHSVDRGFAGLTATLDAFDAAGLGHVGTARTEREALQPQLYTLDRAGQTITVAQLSATYGTNGLPIPAQAPWSVQLVDADQLIAQARAARENGADLVVVSAHAGTEYRTAPTPEQVALATALAASGEIDLYIGHHAHVPQPIELVAGGRDGSGMWVAYGLGNMLSNQDASCCVAATASGLLLTAHVVKAEDGPAHVTGVEWTALSVDRQGGHRLHLLHDAAAGTSGTDGTLAVGQWQSRYDELRAAVGDQAAERTAAPLSTGDAATVVTRLPPG